ncbi:MAG: HD domain-containing protein [Clostridium sp.]|uniref:HD domain-containing protein n=1 Tax=Clostridium sp. TaxID=1506 RepID=UPI0025C2BEFE|nr:HD domain-containing protein [Clostridium sp.]MCE5219680.1 HD domain-containing protein [Clostridium sp.]
MNKEIIINKMKSAFETTIPSEIDYALKVLKNAEIIMDGENVKGRERYLISVTAILHDIGMINAKKKYGLTFGHYQEKEGPNAAKELLVGEGLSDDEIERICYIIGNHHSPNKVEGMDFQIQWEADLIEALKKLDKENIQDKLEKIINKNFKTKSRFELAKKIFIMT